MAETCKRFTFFDNVQSYCLHMLMQKTIASKMQGLSIVKFPRHAGLEVFLLII